MAVMDTVGWPNVVMALIVALPSIIAALTAIRVRKAIQTPSRKPLGEVAEFTHDTAIANNMHLRQLNGGKQARDPFIPGEDADGEYDDAAGR